MELYCEQQSILGESPLWSSAARALYWLDIGRKRLYRKGVADAQPISWALPDYPGCLAELAEDRLAIAMGYDLQQLHLKSGAIEPLRAGPARRPGTRFNDGKVDPRGRFWIGTMQNNFGPKGEPVAIEKMDGALYRFDADGRVHMIEEELGVANTLAWSPGLDRFYFADSLRGQLYHYDFDADSGAVRNKRMFFESPTHGIPDGSAIDVDGCLWNARWDGGALLRITPDGRLDRIVKLPVLRPTSCCFGGPNLDSLYVTSARLGLSAAQLEQYPLSGSVFALTGLAQGMPVPRFVLEAAT